MPVAERPPLLAGRLLALTAILLVALNLRTAVAALSPVAGFITKDIPLDVVSLGVLGMAPPLAFAVGSFLAPLVARRFGLESSLLAAVAFMVVGHLARSSAPSLPVLIVGTLVALLGVGTGNVLVPAAVKRYFPDRIGPITAAYVTIMSIGTALPALVAVPVADVAGWRASLGVWFLSAAIALVPWILLALRARRDAARERADGLGVVEPRADLLGKLFTSPLAWAVTIVFAVSSVSAYGAFAWFPQLLTETAGVSPAQAGSLLALYTIMGFPLALFVPVYASRVRNVGPFIRWSTACFLGGYLGLWLAPSHFTWLWMVLAGTGAGLFPLALVLIGLRSRTHDGAVALSGFAQGIGYIIGAIGTLGMGLLHDATGGWTLPLAMLAVVALGGMYAAIRLAKPGVIEDELAARRGV